MLADQTKKWTFAVKKEVFLDNNTGNNSFGNNKICKLGIKIIKFFRKLYLNIIRQKDIVYF